MMSSANLFSVADELAEILLSDDPRRASKRSPGHESVFSVDSGFVGGLPSPARSELSDCDEMLTFSDLVEQDSAETDLINYLTSTGDENQGGNSVGQSNSSVVEKVPVGVEATREVVGMDCVGGGSEGMPAGTIVSLPDPVFSADLNQLLHNVEKNLPQQGPSRPRRAVRATRGGKSVAFASGCASPEAEVPRAAPSTTPPTRVTRSSIRPRRRPSLTAVTEVLPSLPEVEDVGDIGDKSNKNAIQARINRQKKKAYIEGLEQQVEVLTKENEELTKNSRKSNREVDSLQQEVAYLKSVIANESALAGMLKNIQNVQGVRFTTSFEASRKRRASELDHDYGVGPSKRKPAAATPMSGGVCLHVANETVSMEFCSQCSTMAQGACRSQVPKDV